MLLFSLDSCGRRDKVDQCIIDKVIGEWRKRLRACVVAEGGQFEHNIWTFLIADVLSWCVSFRLFDCLLVD